MRWLMWSFVYWGRIHNVFTATSSGKHPRRDCDQAVDVKWRLLALFTKMNKI